MLLIAAVDIGSSVVKAAVIDGRGTVCGAASVPTRVTSDAPGSAEMEAADLTEVPLATLAEAVARSGAAAEAIGAVAVTGARGTVLALDATGVPIGRAVMWTDTRDDGQLAGFVDRFGGRARMTAQTGLVPDTSLSASVILRWRNERAPAGSAARFGGPQAVAMERLTGHFTTDRTNAAHYGFFLLGAADWDAGLCGAARLDPRCLPALVAPGSAIPLQAAAARRIGLRAGTPVVAAGSDAVCYKLGAGVHVPGEATVSVGTAATFAVIAAEAYADPSGLLSCTASMRPGLWEVFGIQPSGAAMLEWLRTLLSGPSAPLVADLIREADDIAPGADDLLAIPYLMGAGVPQNRDAAAMFAGLRPLHGRAHLARAVMEGVAYSLRDTLEALTASGHRPRLLRMVGGAARSASWAQMLADVLLLPIETVAAEEPGLLGAAMQGAVSVGLHAGLADAAAAMTRTRHRHEPCAGKAETYASGYRRYRRAAASARALKSHTPHEDEP